MGRNATKHPQWACQVGNMVMEYLATTPDLGLVYSPCISTYGAHGHLPIARRETMIVTYTDVSFAPQGNPSCQAIITMVAGSPVQWESNRQPFATLSTAESEMLGYCERMVMTQSMEALMKVLYNDGDFEKNPRRRQS